MAKRKTQTGKRLLLWLIIVIALIGIAFAVITLIGNEKARRDNADATTALQNQAISTPYPNVSMAQTAVPKLSAPSPSPTWPGLLESYARQPDKKIDFDELHAVNQNIYAWITVPGTTIDYPIVHAIKGDELYLEHDIELKKSDYGAIYTDGYNSLGFTDPVTVVYGHNMKDGSMFASLHNFESSEFFDSNRIIKIYMDDYMLEYEIIAAYKTDDTHIMAMHDFSSNEVLSDYFKEIQSIRDLNAKLVPYELTIDDKLITLATCVTGEKTARYLVQGVLKRNERH